MTTDHPRVAFFGSPDFAIPTLEALIASPYRPVVVVTQPDRPAGRGKALRPPPVKVVAEAVGIPVLQPARLRDPEATAALAAFQPELQVIIAYGQILRPNVLALPHHGTLNVHASVLPRWRGASPVAAAIRAGDKETGVTIMLVNEGEDTGSIVRVRREPIRTDDDAGTLSDRLAQMGADLLLDTIPSWIAGTITPVAQNDQHATRAPRLRKEDGVIDWSCSAEEIARQVRALTPWPGATTTLHDRAVRIWNAQAEANDHPASPGSVLAASDVIAVQTGDGALHISQLQRAGKRVMSAREFANGERDLVGSRLGVLA